MIYFEKGSQDMVLTDQEIREALHLALDKIGPRNKVLAIPPDITRFYSKAGLLTEYAWEYYGESMTDIRNPCGHDRSGDSENVWINSRITFQGA